MACLFARHDSVLDGMCVLDEKELSIFSVTAGEYETPIGR